MSDVVAVYLEIGPKRVFAGAIDWPGWCRSGRSEGEALEALVAYAPRYAAVVGRARPTFHPPRTVQELKVVERLKGGSGTDFGVPGEAPAADRRPLEAGELTRFRRLLRQCWSALDAAANAATGVELRKGPRGGGRDLPKIVGHVKEADEAYLHQLGARRPRASGPDARAEAERLHAAMLEALSASARGRPFADPNKVRKPWTPRYFVRRAAWHILDHAWEIEDRATG